MEDEDVPNENNGVEEGGGEEEIALRRNQLLMFGVVLLGILSICLAVSMPSDMEFNNAAIPSSENDPISVIENDTPSSTNKAATVVTNNNNANANNATNISRKSYFKNPEDSVENIILRNIAIHKAIQGLNNGPQSNADSSVPEDGGDENNNEDDRRIDQIVQSFMNTEEFEDFIIDIEITDAIKRLRKEKGYRKRQSTLFDDLFKQIERHFLGDDPKEVYLIRRVGEELESRARQVIHERRQIVPSEIRNEEKQFIASEILEAEEEDQEENDDGSGFMEFTNHEL